MKLIESALISLSWYDPPVQKEKMLIVANGVVACERATRRRRWWLNGMEGEILVRAWRVDSTAR
jgi:hypothetical protein